MKHLNAFQNLVVRICRIKPFDVNAALRLKFQQGKERGLVEGRQEKADCQVCPLWKADQRRLTAIDDQSPTTDGKIAAERMKHRGYVERIRTQHDLPRLPQQRYHKMSLRYIPPDFLL
jgi:hypothetical protein